MRRRRRSPLANPVLVGASTTLIVIVAVFLAYNANNGLPFVPTYQLKAVLPDAAQLVVGNDVRVSGTRVGVISAISADQDQRTGAVTALVTMNLQKSLEQLPVDTTVIVRPRSALGEKYIQLTKGTSRQTYPDGATIPIANQTPPQVEIDQVFDVFNRPTRQASQTNIAEIGDALAGRGQDLNEAIVNLRPLLTNLVGVMRYLSAPPTRLGHLFVSLEDLASIIAPAAQQNAALFDDMDTTFTAIAAVARPDLQDAISEGPATLDDATRAFLITDPFFANSTEFVRELRPGIRSLREAAPSLADALTTGVPTLQHSIAFNHELGSAFVALNTFVSDPLVTLGLSRLRDTGTALAPNIAALAPEQMVCNYVTLYFRNVASLLSDGDTNGTWQRFIVIVPPTGPNGEGLPSSAPANGPSVHNHYHSNPYPYVAAPGQPKECEAANESYVAGKTVIGNTATNLGTNHDVTTRNLSK